MLSSATAISNFDLVFYSLHRSSVILLRTKLSVRVHTIIGELCMHRWEPSIIGMKFIPCCISMWPCVSRNNEVMGFN